MKPSEAFGVVVRVFGLQAWLASLVYVGGVFAPERSRWLTFYPS
jgi:hypothetical protein